MRLRISPSSLVVAALLSPAAAIATEPRVAWASFTGPYREPVSSMMSDRDAELLAHCGAGDERLREASARIVLRRLAGETKVDLDAIAFDLRSAGEPHVWPRAWVVSGRAMDAASLGAKLDAWDATFPVEGSRRCGVASAVRADGTEIVAAVAIDALADLAEPLATTTHAGTWLTIDARILVDARDPRIVLVGSSGEPRTLVAWTEGDRVRARFAPERPGAFTVQVVADVANGTRPLLEARIFADEAPPDRFEPPTAPGEDVRTDPRLDEASSLARMVDALRGSEGLPPFTRDPRLDALALAHARRMLAARTVGHDVGDGDPSSRLEATGARAYLVGENVAHAASIRLAHRALYASPSHRANLLRGELDRAGFAVLDDPDGSVWVVETMAAGLR